MVSQRVKIETQDPSKKKIVSVETGLELIPFVGCGVGAKDSYLYFRNRQFASGSIMAATTVLSLCVDIAATLTAVPSAGTSELAGAATKQAAFAAARKAAQRIISKEAAEKTVSKIVTRKVVREMLKDPELLLDATRIHEMAYTTAADATGAWNKRAGTEVLSKQAMENLVNGSTDAFNNKAPGLADRLVQVGEKSANEIDAMNPTIFNHINESEITRAVLHNNLDLAAPAMATAAPAAAAPVRSATGKLLDKAVEKTSNLIPSASKSIKKAADKVEKTLGDQTPLATVGKVNEKIGKKTALASTTPVKTAVVAGYSPLYVPAVASDAALDLVKYIGKPYAASVLPSSARFGQIYRLGGRYIADPDAFSPAQILGMKPVISSWNSSLTPSTRETTKETEEKTKPVKTIGLPANVSSWWTNEISKTANSNGVAAIENLSKEDKAIVIKRMHAFGTENAKGALERIGWAGAEAQDFKSINNLLNELDFPQAK